MARNTTEHIYKMFIQTCITRIRKSDLGKIELSSLEPTFGHSAFSFMEWGNTAGWISTGGSCGTIWIWEGARTKGLPIAQAISEVQKIVKY